MSSTTSNTATLNGGATTPPSPISFPKPAEKFKKSIAKLGDPAVRTAACLIIGDEVLNGKTQDTNSNFLAKFMFELAIDVKRIEVIADEEDEIVEAVKRLSSKYDIVITSGGIGPTHDDITFQSIGKAFSNGELIYDQETIKRMNALNTRNRGEQTEEQKTARLRMALFPVGSEVLFVDEELWVPVVKINKVHILPEKSTRILIHTELPESHIAPFLTKLAKRLESEDIKVGSYPKLMAGVDVSLIGKDETRLKEISEEVIAELMGKLVIDPTAPAKM